ncbi:hypothetical protein GUITHDRAFT_106553 [Guillardia theta CCMP2712]|uniref:Uncharacterized protein n=1 Tax=Guillardia theta (strain CCMP2712) TaxID=905079 RepID=L1JGE1_GUITC|nr:hypothetical protein GUITHDRAFT_106553 [Guillardia theta CCMP2712]EKX47566.1 hypothetical protein GUITHDRAFT_106553 [Guillardia theta CCMP2712]|eukprot:XP_005834546.1 hypothetical protein GUITHDRAFT_106553 [Guillardia theta CCMP2712]
MPRTMAIVLLLLNMLRACVGDDGVYEEAWGVQSGCQGCSYVEGHVLERPKEEVLYMRCSCPATSADAACICASQYDWWWNLQASRECSKNLTVKVDGCPEGVEWNMVAGNFSGMVGPVDRSFGSCSMNNSHDYVCTGVYGNNRMGSTRRIQIELVLRGNCGRQKSVTWSLPIASDLVLAEVKRGSPAEIIITIVMLVIGMCMGIFLCRRSREPTFSEKPSRYMQEIEREDAFEMT